MGVGDDLEDAVERLRTAQDLAEVQEVIRTSARALTQANGATFVLRDGDRCFYADEDAMSPLWKGQRFPITDCISGWAMLNSAVAVIPDITCDDRIPQDVYRPTFVRSLVMVPIGSPDPVGAIGIYWARTNAPRPDDVAIIDTLADAAATAIRRVGLDDAPVAPVLTHG